MKSSIAVLVVAAACSGSSSKPKGPEDGLGRVEKLSIGGLEAYALADGHLELPNDGKVLGVGQPTSATADLLAAAGLPRDTIRLDIQCLLVKAGDKVMLFDTGLGKFSQGTNGHLTRSLAAAGMTPAAVTDIFISHTHSDHVGGLVTVGGALAFPGATIHLSAPEWESIQAEQDQDAQALAVAIAPKVAAFEPGTQVLPEVMAVDTRGHTPGHSSYLIGTGADAVFYLGDLAHHHVISVQRPQWPIQFDADRAGAEAMRQQTLAKLATDGTRVFAVHFPFPGIGNVVAHGEGQAWKPDAR